MADSSILFRQNTKSDLAKYVYNFVNKRSTPVYFSIMNSQRVVSSFYNPSHTTRFDTFVSHYYRNIIQTTTSHSGRYESHPIYSTQFIKLFRLFHTSPSEYRIPISARLLEDNQIADTRFWWLHPGSCRTSVLEYLHISKIPILIFDDPEKLIKNDNLTLINLKECSIERIHELLQVDKNFTAPYFSYKEVNKTEYFELSESPVHASNFLLTENKYTVEFRTDSVFVNSTRVCLKKNSVWIPDIESIKNHE